MFRYSLFSCPIFLLISETPKHESLKKVFRPLFSLLIFLPMLGAGQSATVDSLKHVLAGPVADTTRVNLLLAVHNQLRLSDFQQASLYADSAYNLALTTDNPTLIARSGQYYATALNLTSRFDEAKEVLAITIEYARQTGNKTIEAYANLTRGNIAYDQSEFAEALPFYQKSKELYLEEDNYAGASGPLIWIGIINQNALKNYPRAIEIYKEAAILAEKGNSTLNKGYILNNLGNIYYMLDEYDSAITYIKESNDIKRRFSDKRGLANGLELLADCYVMQARYAASLMLYEETLTLRQGLGDSIGLANSYVNMGRVFGLNENYNDAFSYINKGRDIARRIGHKETIPVAYQFESELLERAKNYKAALSSYKSFKMISDSLFNLESQKVLEELQVKYDTEGKERQIALQDAEIQGQVARLERNQALIIGLLITALLLIVITLLIRNRAQKEKVLIQKEADLKLREAEINAVIGSQEKERNRFARDLHDGFGQMISVLKMNLGQLGNGASRDAEKQMEIFEQSEQVISEMYSELRNICFDLMPQTLIQQGLPAALREFGQRVTNAGNMALEVLVFDMEERPDELIEVSLYRISQEWVNNILKYSGADFITMQLTRDADEITLTIEDNGSGFDPEDFFNGKGNGWRNIQSRVNLMKGEFMLDSRLGTRGTMVSVNVPVSIPTSTDKQITV